ncbi:MAG: 2-hydroxychromene-2-carboxylate isomerase [Proteobacteria bacterium]|nr:2-hydroxychromene-2-carboxylate isomerase [Pseudomonadota bacterium]
MANPIQFYFDFSSPYGYMAAERIEALASKHGRSVDWKPILLGAIFKVTGGQPMPMIPLKGDYAKRDFVRSAAFHDVKFKYPTNFPISGVPAVRAVVWQKAADPAKAGALAKALYRAFFTEDVNISEAENVVKVAASIGLDANAVRAGMNDQATKDRTKAEVDAAIAAGVFGSPYMVIDAEPFWGMDRFDQMEQWLAKGAW